MWQGRRVVVCDSRWRGSAQVILFIDEVHSVVGAGDADGAMDASSMLKPQVAPGVAHRPRHFMRPPAVPPP